MKSVRAFGFFCSLFVLPSYANVYAQASTFLPPTTTEFGLRFACEPAQLTRLESDMDGYFAALKIPAHAIVKKSDATNGVVIFTLNTAADDYNTLDLKTRPDLHIHDDIVMLPTRRGHYKKIYTVSQKEILLALMQHGRLTKFTGKGCDISALKDHVAIRQNIVAWAENLSWVWPDGDAAQWNETYWTQGTPKSGVALHTALNDVFIHQEKYSIGCYTATKLVVVQGVLDYYRRIKKSAKNLQLIESRLMLDQEPLVGIEPARMWDFEKDFDLQQLDRPGKLLKLKHDVMPLNFVPGDWIYFLNTDPVSYERTGYEGSNAIYLGRDKFDDYYNDHHHSYTYFQKLDEVYQWRNGVFSRSRDAHKIQPLSASDVTRLSQRPADGGLLKSLRAVPYLYAYENLPALDAQP